VAVNAALYYDTTIKVKPDITGERLNPARTCQLMQQAIKQNKYAAVAAIDVVNADITSSDITAQLPAINGLAGRLITFKSASYTRTVSSEELLSFLTVSKEPGKTLTVGWDEAKLDALAADIAGHVDTFTTPALGNCEVLVSSGGTRLDRKAVKDAITSLGADKPTTYALKTYAVAAKTRSRSAVAITGTKGVVYLTYDDGMTFGSTIMNYAACYGVKVTFFEIGARVGTDAALLQRAIAEGHAVQSHGYTHAVKDYGSGHDYTWQFNDIKQSIDAITDVTGVRPTYFRPPGGNRTADTYAAAANNGLKLILWSVTSADTSGNTSSDVCRNVLNGAKAGYNVLMHSSKQKTANAMPCIVEGLAARGYSMQALR
jgi:peptidoglycan/xylan/chitin deacetylase (PgdA/CDA1 family)